MLLSIASNQFKLCKAIWFGLVHFIIHTKSTVILYSYAISQRLARFCGTYVDFFYWWILCEIEWNNDFNGGCLFFIVFVYCYDYLDSYITAASRSVALQAGVGWILFVTSLNIIISNLHAVIVAHILGVHCINTWHQYFITSPRNALSWARGANTNQHARTPKSFYHMLCACWKCIGSLFILWFNEFYSLFSALSQHNAIKQVTVFLFSIS